MTPIARSAMLAVALLVMPVAMADGAKAMECKMPPEAGTWVHPRPRVGVVSSIEVEYACVKGRFEGNWRIRVKSECSPRDCTWGWARGQRLDEARIYAAFDVFFGTRYVTLHTYGKRMQVDVQVTYHDTRKANEHYRVVLERD